MADQNVYNIFSKIFASYSLFLCICALIFNPLVLFICLKSRRLRSTSTFKLLAFSSINDLLSCMGWNQEDFVTTVLNYSTSYLNLDYCRWVSMFLQYSTLEYASWMLVSISLDRLLSMTIKKWSKVYFAGVRPIIYAAVLAFVILAINFNEVFTGGYMFTDGDTSFVICYQTDPNLFDWFNLMSQLFVYFGFLLPYGILLISNSIIIYKATQFSRAQKAEASHTSSKNKRKTQMTRMIVFITFLYLVMSLPGVIVTGYFFNAIYALDAGPMLINLINAFQFSYPAFNFFILFFSNKLFAEEVKTLIFRLRNNAISVATKTNRSSHVPGHENQKASGTGHLTMGNLTIQ